MKKIICTLGLFLMAQAASAEQLPDLKPKRPATPIAKGLRTGQTIQSNGNTFKLIENAVGVENADSPSQVRMQSVESLSGGNLPSQSQVLVQDRNGFVRPLLNRARVTVQSQAEFDEAVAQAKDLGFTVDAKTYSKSLMFTVQLDENNVLKDLKTLQDHLAATSIEPVVGKIARDLPAPR